MKNHIALGGAVFALFIQSVSGLEIKQVEPTPLFPKPAEGQPLKQLARLHLDNPGEPVAAVVRITVGSQVADTQDLGLVAKGQPVIAIKFPDIAAPTTVLVEVLTMSGQPLASTKMDWQPQKKWTLYCVSYSHHDLGFGDNPHRIRTSIRHENIRLPLQFCRETDRWAEDSKYRFNIETTEPITTFINFNGRDAARELARRIQEGRIGLGQLHNTANTELLSHELMARLFYMSRRYAVDLLGVTPNKTMQNDDVIGLSWPLATYAAEADIPYFFHGANLCGRCLPEASREPVVYWQSPDPQRRILMRAGTYGGYSGDNPGDGSEGHILNCIRNMGNNWPYDSLLLQDGTDFKLATRNVADYAHAWNTKWAWPRMTPATFDMFFDAIVKQADPAKIKTIAGDVNNQWSDQAYSDARPTGQARRLGEALPATETLATVSQVVAGGGGNWMSLFQAYNRLLQYGEHTYGAYLNPACQAKELFRWYETEREEHREQVTEASGYQQQVFSNATRNLAGVISRTGQKNLIVFNSLPYQRTDVVRAEIPAESVVDSVTGAKIPVQQLADGTAVFIAKDIPATGYKVYSLAGKARPVATVTSNKALENKFYRMNWNPETGALTSLFDKKLGVELIETNAPHAFNEYLYEFRTHTGGVNFDSQWSQLKKADAITVNRGPVADVLTVTGKATGVRDLKQTVILYHDLPRVDCGIWMDKAPFRNHLWTDRELIGGESRRQHEAVFVALPLAIPQFSIHHELPGAVIEPYREQVKGSATCHYAIRSFTDLSNDKYGVTVSPIEGSLVCYGEPISSPMLEGREEFFKRDQTYPTTSRLYLYLLDNMFDVNIPIDQPGPVSFSWALRSHVGDWKNGGAEQFGRSVQQPLLTWRADGKNAGTLPSSASFMTVNEPNVMCSVIKPAEANGHGFIIRLNETSGKETTATVSLPLLPAIKSVKETSLVENDRTEIPATGNTFAVTLRPFAVKTIRVTCAASPITVAAITAQAVADKQVNLRWQHTGENVSHFNIYRDTQTDCAPTQFNFIGQSATGDFTDLPRPNIGGWLRSCLAPKTTYYYRVVPVDRANNPGASVAVASVTTPSLEQAHLPPIPVEGVRAILVSPISRDNTVNLLFRTACEPDVVRYEIHRSTQPGFTVGTNTLVGVVNSDDKPPVTSNCGGSQILYKVSEYDHAQFADKTVEAGTTYYYKVRAVDVAGHQGAFSEEVFIKTKTPNSLFKATAQSIDSPEFDADNALDGDPDPYRAWISKQYGGGTKAQPLDVWWAVEFLKKPVTIKGVKLVGDHRDVIPLQKNLQVQVREGGVWKTVGELKDATTKDVTISFAQAETTDALRIFVPAADLPKSDRADVDGIVRICEIYFIGLDKLNP